MILMTLMTGGQYEESLRKLNLQVYMFGQKIKGEYSTTYEIYKKYETKYHRKTSLFRGVFYFWKNGDSELPLFIEVMVSCFHEHCLYYRPYAFSPGVTWCSTCPRCQ